MKTLPLAAILLSPTAAWAEMPRYDVNAYCTEIAGLGGTYSEMMYDGCFDMEQSAYNDLKPRWDGLAATLRAYCNEIATLGSPGSYALLEGCVQMEEQAASTDNTFQY